MHRAYRQEKGICAPFCDVAHNAGKRLGDLKIGRTAQHKVRIERADKFNDLRLLDSIGAHRAVIIICHDVPLDVRQMLAQVILILPKASALP